MTRKKRKKNHTSQDMGEYGARLIRRQFDRVCQYREKMKGKAEPEELHQMRVAIRKMRVLLKHSHPYYRPKIVKKLRVSLKEAANVLGVVRDIDTFLLFLDRSQDALPSECTVFLDHLRDRLESSRLAGLESIHRHFSSKAYQEFMKDLDHFTTNVPVKKHSSIKKEIPIILNALLDEICMYKKRVKKASGRELHNLRILFKHLRYLCEFFKPFYGKKIKKVIQQATEVQNCLGEVQDKNRDLLFIQENFNLFSGERSNSRIDKAIHTLVSRMQDVKKEQLRQFFLLWKPFSSKKSCANLRSAFFAVR
jgi:CHAD domain-containing protein